VEFVWTQVTDSMQKRPFQEVDSASPIEERPH